MQVDSKRRRSVLALLAFAALVTTLGFAGRAAAADAFQPKFGSLYEEYGPTYCGCGTLNGTQASIVPNSMNPGSGYCTVFRSDAEDIPNSNYLIQAGVAKCNRLSLQGTGCGKTTPFLFVETDTPSAPFHCVFHGNTTTGTEHQTAVVNAWQNQWSAYIDGNGYETITGITGMTYIVEGAEAVSGGGNCVNFGGPNSATWASDPNDRWQRFRFDSYDWYTIQGSQSSNGCWTINGGPPNGFTISEG